jgi:hypothetical protein
VKNKKGASGASPVLKERFENYMISTIKGLLFSIADLLVENSFTYLLRDQ